MFRLSGCGRLSIRSQECIFPTRELIAFPGFAECQERVSERAQRVKDLAAKPDDLSSMPGTDVIENENQFF